MRYISLRLLMLCLATMAAVAVGAQDLTVRSNEKGKLGYADARGTIVIPCQYDIALPFNKGIAQVAKGKKWGLIDTMGNLIVKCQYDEIAPWTEYIFKVKSGNDYGLVGNTGEVLLKTEYSNITPPNYYGKALIAKGGKATKTTSQPIYTYMQNAKYGIVNSNGSISVPAEYQGLYEFSTKSDISRKVYGESVMPAFTLHPLTDTLKTDCKYLAITKNGMSSTYFDDFGVIDSVGTVLMPLSDHWYVMQPASGMIRWYDSKKNSMTIGYYDIEKQKDLTVKTINQAFKDIDYWTHGDFTGNIAPVNDAAGWQFIDRDGNVKFSGFKRIKHNRIAGIWAAYSPDDVCSIFDENGETLFADKGYTDIEFAPAEDGAEYLAVSKGGKWGLIDTQGNEIIPFKYEKTLTPRKQIVFMKTAGKWGAQTLQKKELVPCKYDDMKFPVEDNPTKLWVKKSDKLYYTYDLATKKESTTGYSNVTSFRAGYAWATPSTLTVTDNLINRTQAGVPAKDTENATFASVKNNFGYIIGENGTTYVDQPVALGQYDNIMKVVKQKNRPLTASEIRVWLLQTTRSARTYPLNQRVSEEDWDY